MGIAVLYSLISLSANCDIQVCRSACTVHGDIKFIPVCSIGLVPENTAEWEICSPGYIKAECKLCIVSADIKGVAGKSVHAGVGVELLPAAKYVFCLVVYAEYPAPIKLYTLCMIHTIVADRDRLLIE